MLVSIIESQGFRRVALWMKLAWRLNAIMLTNIVFGLRQQRAPSFQQLRSLWRWANPSQAALTALIACCALTLWNVSLGMVNIRDMSGLGLVSVLPIGCFIALGGISVGFCLVLLRAREQTPPWILAFYLLTLIYMLYATPALVEQAPRFQVTYWLAGHTEYIMRTGAVAPGFDAYFNWPGFFVLTGLLTSVTGLHSVLAFAPWASFVYNLLYLAPMYIIYSTLTRDRRLIWLGLWLFYINDWVWQDYFSPQGLNLFLYLVIIAILLKWFRTTQATPKFVTVWTTRQARLVSVPTRPLTLDSRVRRIRRQARAAAVEAYRHPIQTLTHTAHWFRMWILESDTTTAPDEYRKRIALLVTLIGVFALSVYTHPITPFFVLISVTALVLFGQCTPRWLPILMAAMILGWDFTGALPYMTGHLSHDLAAFGNLKTAATANVTNRLATGSADHHFIAQVRIVTTAAIWGLALLGAALRWRRGAVWYADESSWGTGSLFTFDLKLTLLAIVPMLMIVAQPYGGEMAMRSFLLSLPFVTFFAAAAFCTPAAGLSWRPVKVNVSSRAFTIASTTVTVVACLFLLTGFMFARYGNERADFITYNEANAVSYLYSVAPPHSLLIQGWSGTPWRYQDLEMYTYFPHALRYSDAEALRDDNISGILGAASSDKFTESYVIITRSQKMQAEMFYGVPPAAFDAVEHKLLASGKFVLVYKNSDAAVLMYVRPHHSKKDAHPNHPFSTTLIARELSQ